MSVWNEHKPSSGSGDYLKLKNGDKKKVRFVSEPAIVTYDGKKLRYQVVLYNKTDKVAQIYEFGPQIFGQFGELTEEWGEPTDFDVTIGRTGSTQFDTNYSVTPSPKSTELTQDEINLVNAVKFPGNKAKMLADYMEDGILPETIETSKNQDSLLNGATPDDSPLPDFQG
jgi:hypothetical protein